MNIKEQATTNWNTGQKCLWGIDTMRALFFILAILFAVSPVLRAENRHPHLLNLEFKQQALYGIDANNSLKEDENLFRRNQHYLRDTLKSYSQQTLSLVGLPDQTAKFMGATIGFVTQGAKLDLNDSKTLSIEFKHVATHDPALYFGYDLNW